MVLNKETHQVQAPWRAHQALDFEFFLSQVMPPYLLDEDSPLLFLISLDNKFSYERIMFCYKKRRGSWLMLEMLERKIISSTATKRLTKSKNVERICC